MTRERANRRSRDVEGRLLWVTTRALMVLALGSGLLLCGCSKDTEKQAEPPAVPAQVAEAHRESIQRIIAAEGILRAVDQSAVTPKISAPISKFYVNRGDHVRKGQLVALLEDRDLVAAVADAKGAYEQASANYRNVTSATVPDELVKAEADVQAAEQSLDASKKLLESREQLFREGAVPRRLVDEASVSYAQAKSLYDTAQKRRESLQRVGRDEEINSAAAQLASAKGKYEAAGAQLSYSEISSPISGVVSDRVLFPGEMASAGSPLLTVMDVSSVVARVNIPQAQAAYVRMGQAGRITPTDGSTEVNGKVTVVSPAIDLQSTTVEIWVQAPNPGERLRPGGTVRVSILADTIPDAVVVPPAALLPSPAGGFSVMVVGADFIAHEQKIQVGVRSAAKVQILGGVAPGDRVITSGGFGLQDGAKIRVQEPAENGKKAGGS